MTRAVTSRREPEVEEAGFAGRRAEAEGWSI
jgi:hypothetical protein